MDATGAFQPDGVPQLFAALGHRDATLRNEALDLLERAGEPGPPPAEVIPELVRVFAKKVRRSDAYWLSLRLATTLLRIGRSSPQSENELRGELARADLGPKIGRVEWVLENLATRVPRIFHAWTGPEGDARWVHSHYGLLTWKVPSPHANEHLRFQRVDDFVRDGVPDDVIAHYGRRGVPSAVLDAIYEALGVPRPKEKDAAFSERLAESRRLIDRLRAAKWPNRETPCEACGPAPSPERLTPLVDMAGDSSWLICPTCGTVFCHYSVSEWMGFYREETDSMSRTEIETLAHVLEHACDYDQGFTIHWEAVP
jgi:hypothetical protein